MQDEDQERQRRGDGEDIEEPPDARRQHADDRRHAHMFAALERQHRAEHRQPQEQDAGEFVGPDERLVQKIPRRHAGEEDDDLDDHEDRRGDAHQGVEGPFDGLEGRAEPCDGRRVEHDAGVFREMHGGQPTLACF